jgi:alkanesulfonate monooxygenase SsuD/methylene tetrahydromethanopterin reductase-like flavin-dependent oxidoreductase (luciferase family)
VRFGVAIPAYGPDAEGAVVRQTISVAEALGLESVWLPDHIAVPDYATSVNLSVPFLEPLAACGWGLGATTRLRFGVDVLVAPYRHPLLVAAMTGTLARLGGDRLVLGVGIGYLRGEFEALGLDCYDDRAAVTEEFLRTWRVTPADLHVVSPPTPIPVWVGGNARAARRRAALLGDGWHPLWMPAEDYRAARDEIEAWRAKAGLTGPFTFSYSCGPTAITDGEPGTWTLRPRAPVGSEFRYAPEAWTTADGRVRLVGTPEQVTADLRLLEEAGVEHVVLRFGPNGIEQMGRFAREVLPAFAAA